MTSRLARFEIDGLFGLYSHVIDFNLKERITIIIGPNGRGKTVCLKCIEALFSKRFSYFREIPFSSAKFHFTGGEIISIHSKRLPPDSGEGQNAPSAEFSLSKVDAPPVTWSSTSLDSNLNRELRRFVPTHYQQLDYDLWIDRRDDEEVDLNTLISRHNVPSKLAAALRHASPPEVDELLGAIDCHLIETQRLLVLPNQSVDEEIDFERGHLRRTRRPNQLAIRQKAGKLQAILKDKLSESASLSQSLDRTFPLRVFDAQGSTKLSGEQLREELKQLDQRREALMAAGILDTDYEPVALRGGYIDPGVAKALEIYVRDTTRKLEIFNDLRARVDLFKNLMDQRFIDKTIQIDRENGYKIFSQTGKQVPLDKLSSGEQHQLILVFDLLFEVTRDSLILIDEPELSLHVAWQKTFIESLEQIISLNSFDVLLATHSPALVAKHFSLAVELGPVDEGSE